MRTRASTHTESWAQCSWQATRTKRPGHRLCLVLPREGTSGESLLQPQLHPEVLGVTWDLLSASWPSLCVGAT